MHPVNDVASLASRFGPRPFLRRALAFAALVVVYVVPSLSWISALAPHVFAGAPRLACICRDGHQDECPHCKKAQCPACSRRTHAPETRSSRGDADAAKTGIAAPCTCGSPVQALRVPAQAPPHLLVRTLAIGASDDPRFCHSASTLGRSVYEPEPPRKVPLSSITTLI